MTKRIELSSDGGQWIEVKDVTDLRHGDTKAVKAAVPVSVDPNTGAAMLPGDYQERTRDAMASRIIVNWTLPAPLPNGDPSALDNLTASQINALYAGIEDHMEAIRESNEQNRPGANPTNAA